MSVSDTALAPRSPAPLQPQLEAPAEPHRRCICFRACGEWLALPIERVREIQPLPALIRVPNAAPEILGIVNLRGHVLTLLSLAAALGSPATDPPAYCVVLDLGDVDPYVGVAIQAVGEVLSVPLSAIEVAHGADEGPGGIEGVFEASRRVVGLLDLGRLYARLLAEWGVAVEAVPGY